MTADERKGWLHAAYAVLRDYPADLIERGAKQAALVADHPAKIVPAIIRAIEDDLRWRNRKPIEAVAYRHGEPRDPGEAKAVGDGLADLVKRLGGGIA